MESVVLYYGVISIIFAIGFVIFYKNPEKAKNFPRRNLNTLNRKVVEWSKAFNHQK
ncbi:hypothetical protein KEH51_20575 [[Brevibacterium] frigoritolerans]|uniref:Uncharacterized protein n=1 Tax=Peribacillus frigoritolerans TaxID=450367 RepID=A0A941FSZ2_9BACI|nr:hypothetical protein [Peribacillus frigoritolerans]